MAQLTNGVANLATARFIGGEYEPDLNQPLAEYGGGLDAYAVRDRNGAGLPMVAIEVGPDDPPRPRPLAVLATSTIPHLMLPLAHGLARWPDGRAGQFVICLRPPGSPLSQSLGLAGTWDEATLLAEVLRPAALALAGLRESMVTHRAIRPDNVFRGTRGPVTLGCAWASAGGSRQPAAIEPLASAICRPAGRGDGSFADDVYALGALLVTLLGGRLPLAGLTAREVTQRKLELGSFKALTAGLRLPPLLGDLLAGMLADEPEHRPLPASLADPEQARLRRLATRPPRRADRALSVGRSEAWTARGLAYALAAEPAAALRALRDGSAVGWLQRVLGDPIAAAALDEAAPRGVDADGDARDEAILLMRAVAALDAGAPLCWRGQMLWPDALGPALAAADDAAQRQDLQMLLELDPVPAWLEARGQRSEPGSPMLLPRLHKTGFGSHTAAAAPLRLRYALNPLLACRAAGLGGGLALTLADVPPALEALAARGEQRPDLPLDLELVAFIAARLERRVDPNLAQALPSPKLAHDRDALAAAALAQLRILGRIQGERGPPLPNLAAWLASRTETLLSAWRSRSAQADRRAALRERTTAGMLIPLLSLLDDGEGIARDRIAADEAVQALAGIDHELSMLRPGASPRLLRAQAIGRELAVALGIIALSGTVLSVLFG